MSDSKGCTGTGTCTIRLGSINMRWALDQADKRFPCLRDQICSEKLDLLLVQEAFHPLCYRRIAPHHLRVWHREYGTATLLQVPFGDLGEWLTSTRLWHWYCVLCCWVNFLLFDLLFGCWAMTLYRNPLVRTPVYALLGSAWTFGNATLALSSRAVAAVGAGAKEQMIFLGDARPAVAVKYMLDGDRQVTVINVHFSEMHAGAAVIEAQFKVLAAALPPEGPVVVAGDFNDKPGSFLYTSMKDLGFVSAYEVVHGAEPPWTYPTSLRGRAADAEESDVEGRERKCLDYIFVRGLRVQECELFCHKASPRDATVYPSDHIGLRTVLTL